MQKDSTMIYMHPLKNVGYNTPFVKFGLHKVIPSKVLWHGKGKKKSKFALEKCNTYYLT